MAFTFHLGAAIAVASALAMVALGLLVLRLGSDHGSTATFGAFALAWSAEVLAANAMTMSTSASVSYGLALAFQALLFVACVPVLVFALTYPRAEGLLRPRKAWTIASAAVAPFLVTMAAQPSLFVESARGSQAATSVSFGPLSGIPSAAFLAFFLAGVGVLAYRLHRSPRQGERRRLGLLLCAFVLYVSYQGALAVGWLGPHRELYRAARGAVSFWTIATLLTAAAIATLLVLLWACSTPDLPWRRLTIACTLVPFLTTVGTIQLQAATETTFSTVGFWRTGMVAVLAYAIARSRLFDLEVRLRDAIPVAVYVGLVGVGSTVLWMGFGDVFRRPWWSGVGASVGIAACCWPSMNLAEAVMDRHAGHLDDPDHLHRRKLEVYRSALADARADSISSEEQRFLADLRQRLGINADEHRALVATLEASGGTVEGSHPEEGRFHVLAKLGEGSLGRALLAHDGELEREVVLKEATAPWLHNGGGRELFLQEGRLAAQLDDPNVVRIYDVLPERDPPTLVLEHVPGGSLADRVREEGPLAPPKAIDVLAQVLAGLAAIHEQGIVHRDLKPSNVLVTEDGQAKVSDLGVARPPEHLERRETRVVVDRQPGTVAYMSPEQARGVSVDERSDIYAAGVNLFHLLTGELPTGADGGPRPGLRGDLAVGLDDPRITRDLRDVLERALARDPEDRFATAEAMREALVRLRPTSGLHRLSEN